ncbi:fibrinogen C domain-containing protein 1-like [Topomyia yanbarensis]|uniref:fibrinogen C domain-containing protein 1-like n=1 Tax=Topomyia yanbarensis TaxID=2498891 RepID=UPI00273AC09C|nr:fibrinogen C domain-containing protein 1-like [Topomyia yanbarensis]
MLLLGCLSVIFFVASAPSLSLGSEVSANVSASGFGYELITSGLDTVNFNMQKDHLRSKEYFQMLSAEIENLHRTLRNTEQMVIRHSKLLSGFDAQLKKLTSAMESVETIPSIQNELDLLSLNISRLLNDASNINRVQQTLPTTEMLNDFILQLAADRLQSHGTDSRKLLLESKVLPSTCANVPESRSGVRRIHPQPGFKDSFEAYCDQDYEGGGWTVIQNRFDGSVNFYRGWDQYENGFGDLRGEFWLGLKKIHELTYAKPHELHIVMEDFEGKTAVAKYSHVLVGGPEQKYALNSLGNYSGDAGDSLSDAVNLKFSTLDVDNDTHPPDSCAVTYKGAWWYGACHSSNLNGLYLKGKVEVFATMMCWKAFKGYHYGLKSSRMMIRVSS